MPDQSSLGEYLKPERESRGVTQGVIAAATGREQQAISLWEADKRRPSLVDLGIIARTLDLPIGELTSRLEADRERRIAIKVKAADAETPEAQQLAHLRLAVATIADQLTELSQAVVALQERERPSGA